MKILESIPIRLELDRILKELHLPDEKKSPYSIRELIETAESLIQARAVFQVSYIQQRGISSVTLDGITFASRVLAVNVKNTERTFPYIITIGKDLEDQAGSSGDLLKQFYLETMGDMALRLARDYLGEYLKKNYGIEKTASLSPGSLKDWPITEQKLLFSLFKDKGRIGVRLTESMLMIPRKSISGIYFATEAGFYSCQLCPRKKCPARKAAYDKTLRATYGLEDEDADGYGSP